MTTRSERMRLGTACILSFFILWISLGETSLADPSLERQRALLEKGLTLHEIDRELERIEQHERRLERQIAEAEQALKAQEQAMESEKERTGKVLHAYYTGQRDDFLFAFLHMENWSDLFTVLEYVQYIFTSDRETIQRYTDSTEALKQTVAKLQQTEAEIAEVKQLYLERKQLAIDTEAELNEELAAMANADEVQARIKQLTEQWGSHGLPLFRQYFQALAKAMNDLPEILDDGEHLTMSGLTWNFRIKDSDLNDFLEGKNELFANIAFRFDQEGIIAEGTADGTSLLISGQFSILEEPVHHIGFNIMKLEYEGFQLPRSTTLDMEEQFDLGFYPKAIVPFVKATELFIENNELHITLEVDLS